MTPRASVMLAALFGVTAAFGQAPYDVPLMMLLGMAGAVWVYQKTETSKQAAWIGWAFGAGYFGHALRWIVSPFLVDVARHGWMAPFALVLMAGGLALFWGLAFWLARRCHARMAWPLILCWPAAELLRAYIFTGFPWAMPAQALVGVIAGQAMAWVGPYALNIWLVAVAVGLVHAFAKGRARRVGGILLASGTAVVMILPPASKPSAMTPHTIRLVQPNATQREKWDPEKIPVFYDRQLTYSAAAPLNGGPVPDLVIWSETAIPWPLDLAGVALEEIAFAGGSAPVALGAQRRTETRYFNSMVVLDPVGAIKQTYDKRHLVPFGEYMPFGDFLAKFGIYGLASQAGNGFTAGTEATLLDFGAVGKALPLICYEAVFANDAATGSERPEFLVQITNDAWFGKGAGPKQHLAQARMRAIEQGLPLARAANTGISAMIDPKGRVTASLALNTAGFIDAALPAPASPTQYSRMGDLPLTFLLLIGLVLAVLRRWSAS